MLLTQNLTLLLIRTSTVDPLLTVKFIPLTGDLLFINRVHPCRDFIFHKNHVILLLLYIKYSFHVFLFFIFHKNHVILLLLYIK